MASEEVHFSTNAGDFSVELYPSYAPRTCKNFSELCARALRPAAYRLCPFATVITVSVCLQCAAWLLRRHNFPPHYQGFYDSGRRPDGYRQGWREVRTTSQHTAPSPTARPQLTPVDRGRSIYGGKFQDEIKRELKHTGAGIVSMANAGPNTNGSQFFITLAPTPFLDGKHTVFGRISSGMQTVKRLGVARTDANDRPVDPVRIVRASVGTMPAGALMKQ